MQLLSSSNPFHLDGLPLDEVILEILHPRQEIYLV